ncbi:hypothetical protein N480_15955 [Pseudoalteromonas luteoviolacea S2607]|nr:hypothetical protein N480_15955 [Pseudoalteromonas luteoviolacea S2607]
MYSQADRVNTIDKENLITLQSISDRHHKSPFIPSRAIQQSSKVLMTVAYILAAILVKTSLLGLGSVSIILSIFALLIMGINRLNLSSSARAKFKRIFKVALAGHLLAYLGLLVKVLLIDGAEDIPALIVSHFVLHHVLCALVAGTITYLTLRLYTQISNENDATE